MFFAKHFSHLFSVKREGNSIVFVGVEEGDEPVAEEQPAEQQEDPPPRDPRPREEPPTPPAPNLESFMTAFARKSADERRAVLTAFEASGDSITWPPLGGARFEGELKQQAVQRMRAAVDEPQRRSTATQRLIDENVVLGPRLRPNPTRLDEDRLQRGRVPR